MSALWETQGSSSLTIPPLFRKEKAGRKGVCRANPALTTKPIAEVPLALTPHTSGIRRRQYRGFVYFIAPEAMLHRRWDDDGKVVKIGFTKADPRARLKSLQTGCPLPLVLWAYTPGTFELEQALHACFAELRHMGEWFHAIHKLEDMLVFLGEEPDIGHLIDEDRFASIIGDTQFTDNPPHPSVPADEWRQSANPDPLAGFFPDEWAEWLS